MKKPFQLLNKFVAFLFFLCCFYQANATHYAGADLTYTYSGTPNTYTVTLKLYRDCCPFCSTFLTDYEVCYRSASTGLQGSLIVSQIPNTGNLIPPSTCVNTPQCYEEYIFQGTVVLPQAAADWVLTYNGYARNDAITTIQNPGGQGLAVRAYLDNLNFPTNSSPEFLFIPVQLFCVGNQFYFDQGASDPDNDSLVFSFAPAEGDINTACPINTVANLQYVSPYTFTDPIATVSGININPQTGVISFVPSLQQIGVICVKVEEYQNGILKGSVKRDIQVVIQAGCNVLPPTFENSIVQTGIQANCGDNTVLLTFQEPIQCGSAIPTDLQVRDPNGLPNPVIAANPVNCVNGLTDSLLITLYYPVTFGTSLLFTKIGNDGNTFLSVCGSQMAEFDSLQIIVDDSIPHVKSAINVGCYFNDFTVTLNQDILCSTISSDLSEFTLLDANGTTIPISSIITNCNPTSQYSYINQITFSFASGISAPGPLQLFINNGTDLNTISDACGRAYNVGDTLAELTVINSILVNLPADTSLCDNGNPFVINSGVQGASYSWTLDGNLLADTTSSINATTSGNYAVVVTYGAACSGTDTVNVTFNTVPQVTLGNDIFLCTGDPIPALSSGVSNAQSYQWYNGTTLIAGATDSVYTPTQPGIYSVTVSNGGVCSGTDEILIVINAALPVALGNDIAICDNAAIPTLHSNVVATNYTWYLNYTTQVASGPADSIYTPTQAGIYTVIANSSTCNGTDTLELQINASPTAVITGDTVACQTQTLTVAGNSGATFTWSVDGLLTGVTDSVYTTTQTGQHVYTVTVTNISGCTATAQTNVTVYQQAPSPNVADQAYCTGTLIPSLTTAVTGVSYQWYDAANNPIPGATNSSYQPSAPGTYSLTVNIGTCSASDPATVSEVASPAPVLSNISLCNGANLPALNANANVAGYTYQWTLNSNNISGATDSIYQVPAGTVTGVYTYGVTVSNSQSGLTCSGNATMTLTVNPSVTVALAQGQTICAGDSASLDAQNSGSSYLWNTGATSQTIIVYDQNSYTVIVTDANGCTGTDNAQVTVNSAPSAAITASQTTLNNQILVCHEDSFPSLSAVAPTGGTVSWNYNGTISTSSSIQVASGAYGIYEVTVTDANLCANKSSVEVIEDECGLTFYNVITPNGDDDNPFFFIKNIETHTNCVVRIYNRWGNKVYDRSNYKNDSNAFSGKDLPDGTYFYSVETPDDGKKYNGTVTVISNKSK